MQITFLVNDAEDIQPTQTTAMLISAAVNQGHEVAVTGICDLAGQPDGQPWAHIRWLPEKLAKSTESADLLSLTQQIAQTAPVAAPLTKSDWLFIRTNPARGDRAAAHHLALNLARLCQAQGVQVINQPDGLIRAATKLYLLDLPDFTRPKTLVSQSRADIIAFIQALNAPAVLKPIQGTRGNDVFFIHSAQDSNLNQIIDVILRQGPVMAQRCIPGAAAGDTRVVVFNGQVLEINGKLAAIQRVPQAGDFRSNIHAGGSAQPGQVTADMTKVVAAIGPKLLSDGLFLVGLDFIGAQLVEINVFSTGGLRDADRFTGERFAEAIISRMGELER
ncbi:MAG: glutathione synthase [Phormidesmis sp. RL_2_1]|nr:glutathione synthase [Phormidesmis sp. RL_2_1]